jgi:hypothetical protein
VLGSARPFGRTAAAGPGVSRRYVALGFLRRFGFIPACPRLFRSSIGFGRGFVLPMRRPARVCLVAPRPLTSAVELAATLIRIRIRFPHRCVREFMVLPPLATIPAPHRPASSLAGDGSLVATAPGVGCATHFHRAKHPGAGTAGERAARVSLGAGGGRQRHPRPDRARGRVGPAAEASGIEAPQWILLGPKLGCLGIYGPVGVHPRLGSSGRWVPFGQARPPPLYPRLAARSAKYVVARP